MSYKTFECYNCAKCCPGVGEIILPQTPGDLFRYFHYTKDIEKGLSFVDLAMRFNYAGMDEAFFKKFNQKMSLPKDILFLNPVISDCDYLNSNLRCMVHDIYVRPIHCCYMPESEILTGPVDGNYMQSARGMPFKCLKDKEFGDDYSSFMKVVLLKTIAEFEQGLGALLFKTDHRISGRKLINIKNPHNSNLKNQIRTYIEKKYFGNKERRMELRKILIYTSNEIKTILNESDLIDPDYQDPVLDTKQKDSFPERQLLKESFELFKNKLNEFMAFKI